MTAQRAVRDPNTGRSFSILRDAPMPIESKEAWEAFRRGLGRSSYNSLYVIGRIAEPLGEDRFVGILEALAALHGALRTRVYEQDGEVYLAETDSELQIEIIDGTGLDEIATDRLVSEITWRDFRFHEDAPLPISDNLFRAFLIKRPDRPDICGMVFHHQVADHVSVRNLRFDFRKLFFKKAPLTEGLQRQYQILDHIEALDDLMSSPLGREQVDEFEAAKADAAEVLARASLTLRDETAIARISVDDAIVQAVNAFSAETAHAAIMLVIAAQALAHRACYDLSRVPINLTHHGRTDLRSFRAIGYFPVRKNVWIDLSDSDQTVDEFLSSIKHEIEGRLNLPPIEHLLMTRPAGEVLNYVDNTTSQIVPPFLDNVDPPFVGDQGGTPGEILRMFAKPALLRVDKHPNGMGITHITRWSDKAGAARYVAAFVDALDRLTRDKDARLGDILVQTEGNLAE